MIAVWSFLLVAVVSCQVLDRSRAVTHILDLLRRAYILAGVRSLAVQPELHHLHLLSVQVFTRCHLLLLVCGSDPAVGQ